VEPIGGGEALGSGGKGTFGKKTRGGSEKGRARQRVAMIRRQAGLRYIRFGFRGGKGKTMLLEEGRDRYV